MRIDAVESPMRDEGGRECRRRAPGAPSANAGASTRIFFHCTRSSGADSSLNRNRGRVSGGPQRPRLARCLCNWRCANIRANPCLIARNRRGRCRCDKRSGAGQQCFHHPLWAPVNSPAPLAADWQFITSTTRRLRRLSQFVGRLFGHSGRVTRQSR